jgi:hypothetical protein
MNMIAEVGRMQQMTIDTAPHRSHQAHDTWIAAIRLAAIASVVAAAAAVILTSLAGLPAPTVVVAMMVFGFVASWIETGRVRHRHATVRVAPLHARRPVG